MFKSLMCFLLVIALAIPAFCGQGSLTVRQEDSLMKVFYNSTDSLGAVVAILKVVGGIPSNPQWIDTVHNNGLNIVNIVDNKITIVSFSTKEGLSPGEHYIFSFKVSSLNCTIDTVRNDRGIGSQFCYLNANEFSPAFNFEPVGVGEDPTNVLPTKFELKNPYPNPFNPNTVITFSLPTSSHVNLTIYNVRGQKVATLVSENLPVGTYNVIWNVGNEIASGIYFCILKANNFKQVCKLTLMK